VPTRPAPDASGSSPAGLASALGAYLIWGFMPLYFLTLAPAGPVEVLAWRILLALAVCVLLVTITRGWRRLAVVLRDRRTMLVLGGAGLCISLNWLVFLFASLTGHVVESSLGYFINPIVTVLLGVLLLRERLRPMQWVAVGVSALAVVVIAVGYGELPWISLVLAASFGLYGYIKKRVGGTVDAIGGLTIETLWLALPAAVVLGVVTASGDLAAGANGPGHLALILAAGVVTAVPLLLFAMGARRLPLVMLGLTQYVTPVMQLVIGVVILREPMPAERWIGFALVWVALIVLTIDSVRSARAARRLVTQPV
jgi:chloramphenicol-sensitive protein RarD